MTEDPHQAVQHITIQLKDSSGTLISSHFLSFPALPGTYYMTLTGADGKLPYELVFIVDGK